MARRRTDTKLRPPFLKRVWLDPSRVDDPDAYPFCLPFLADGFELDFEQSVTVIVGENGVGKSTLIEGIAALAGYDDAGGGKGYSPVDHSEAIERSGGVLGQALKGAWLPKITNGWFFKAETFFSVARYLDLAAQEPLSGPPPDYLSHSHGEGFLRFFDERLKRQGLYFFDEPESALSPSRQVEFLKVLRRMQKAENAQVIIATHSPMIMALPDVALLRMTRRGLESVTLEETDHFQLWREFCLAPATFMEAMLDD